MSVDLVAKPVVDQEFWLLHENEIKIGNVLAHSGRYQVKIRNQITEYPSLAGVEEAIGVKLESAPVSEQTSTINGYHTLPGAAYPSWDVAQGLPVFARNEHSQCWHAAGWYRIKRGENWQIKECPKIIYLQRYPYQGPYLTKQEAQNDQVGI